MTVRERVLKKWAHTHAQTVEGIFGFNTVCPKGLVLFVLSIWQVRASFFAKKNGLLSYELYLIECYVLPAAYVQTIEHMIEWTMSIHAGMVILHQNNKSN